MIHRNICPFNETRRQLKKLLCTAYRRGSDSPKKTSWRIHIHLVSVQQMGCTRLHWTTRQHHAWQQSARRDCATAPELISLRRYEHPRHEIMRPIVMSFL